MKEIESRLVGCAPGKNRIKVTWEIRHGWFWASLTGLPRVMQITAMYEGTSTVWRVLPECKRVGTLMESMLADIEYRLLNQPTAKASMKSIHLQEVECTENACNWYGTVSDCLPDVDGEGTIGCPLCQAAVRVVTAQKATEVQS